MSREKYFGKIEIGIIKMIEKLADYKEQFKKNTIPVNEETIIIFFKDII